MWKLLKTLILPYQNQESPFHAFANGASYGFLVLTVLVFTVAGSFSNYDLPKVLMLSMGVIAGFLAYVIAIQILQFFYWVLSKLPLNFSIVTLGSVAALFLAQKTVFSLPEQPYYIGAFASIILFGSLLGSVFLLRFYKSKWPFLTIILCVAGIALGLYWLSIEGSSTLEDKLPPIAYLENTKSLEEKGILNPSEMGAFEIESFTYGSGTDARRAEFRKGVRFTSTSVDATRLLADWKGKKKKWREKYWGFGLDSLPLNGRVTLPIGDGPFPVFLIVHGNHSMTDYSDEGYAYLTDILASKGIIALSIDENFLNSHWSGDFRGKEMPARAWLILKHLEQLSKWNGEKGHELEAKMDLNNIVLAGHSRGGEAVSIAAAFNNLDHYPDDALETFDFRYGINGIISIAPTDYRYHRKIELKNLNYLSLQGSYDSDESSFWGFRNYQRLKFDDGEAFFKAAVYIHKANHGQFNSTWDRSDMGAPMKWLLNTKSILSRGDQEKTAKVYITSFVEACLLKNDDYLPVFQNSEVARSWLPENYFLTNYQTSEFKAIANFEEDINALSGNSNVKIYTQNLRLWKEEQLQTRDAEDQDNNAVLLGWDYGDEIKIDSIAVYSLLLETPLPQEVESFQLSVAAGDISLLKYKEEDRKDPALDFSIEFVSVDGTSSRLQLSEIKRISPRLKVQFGKEISMNKRFGADWEPQLESFTIPVQRLNQNGNFNVNNIQSIRILFDQNKYGVLYLDDIGWN